MGMGARIVEPCPSLYFINFYLNKRQEGEMEEQMEGRRKEKEREKIILQKLTIAKTEMI